MKKAIIEISAEGYYMTLKDGAQESTKAIEYDDLTEMFSRNFIETPILPAGTIYYAKKDGSEVILFQDSPKIRQVLQSSYGTSRHTIPTPNTIFGLGFRNSVLTTSLVGTTVMPAFSLETTLKDYPFGNIYNDGRVCWGSAEIGHIDSIVQVNDVISEFYNASFNGDLFRSPNGESLRSYIESLEGQQFFPSQDLRSHPNYNTLGEMLNDLKESVGLHS